MNRSFSVVSLAFLMIGPLVSPAAAASSDDPDWPCIQRKVETLSVAAMWPGPLPQGELTPAVQTIVEDTAEVLALRRVSLEEVERIVENLAEAHPEMGADAYGALFAETFGKIDNRRSLMMRGIGRYARNQAAMVERIEELRTRMSELEQGESPDHDEMDRIEAELDWNERIFTDRRRSLTYVCETPVLLERRAFAIAQILSRHLPE